MTKAPRPPEFRVDVSPAELADELDRLVGRDLDRSAVPGLALAVVRDGEVIASGGWGQASTANANPATAPPMTAHSKLEAASLAKPLTAFLALSLVAEGVLELDSPLVSHLPVDSIPGVHPEDPRWRRITLRHVLSHTTGLSHTDPPVILAPPGQAFLYSLGGFALLQRALEHGTGLDFARLAAERIFQPFGMAHSSFLPPSDPDEQIARGHDARGCPLPLPKSPRPRAWNSLWTSAIDYARFLARISSSGEDRRLEDLRRSMLEPQAKIHDELYWTLGWGLQEGRSGSILWHWGGPSGGRHYVAFSPTHRIGLVLLTNSAIGDELWPRVVGAAMGGHHLILPWGKSLWWRADRRRELAEVEKIERRHEAFAVALGRTLSEQTGAAMRVEPSFTELAPYSECVLAASRFATCIVRLGLGPQKLDAILNLPVAALRGLLGSIGAEPAARLPDSAELRRLEPIARRIAADLAAAWETEGSTLEIGLETDPEAVALAEADEPILLSGFRVVAAAPADPAAAQPIHRQPSHQRYQLAFTVGYPLSRL